MHNKHARDGLVILTVTLDDPTDAKARASVESYLNNKLFKATKALPFRTLNLDVDPEKRPAPVNFTGSPGVFVFNRDNRYIERLDSDKAGDPKVIDKLVAEALKKK